MCNDTELENNFCMLVAAVVIICSYNLLFAYSPLSTKQ